MHVSDVLTTIRQPGILVNVAVSLNEPSDTSASPVASPEAAVERARLLLRFGDNASASAILDAALREYGDQAALLLVSARIAFDGKDVVLGTQRLAEAMRIDSGASTVTEQVRILDQFGMRRLAVLAIATIPPEVREDPAVRTAVGDFYRQRNINAHAAAGYGAASGLTWRARRHRVRALLLSGALPAIRKRVFAWESTELLTPLIEGPPHLSVLDDAELGGRDRAELRAQMERFNNSLLHLSVTIEAFVHWYRRLLPGAVAPLWLLMWWVAFLIPGKNRPSGLGLPALCAAAIATAVGCAVYRRVPPGQYWYKVSNRHVAMAIVLAGGVVAAAAEGYRHHIPPAAGWWFTVVYGLVATPIVTMLFIAGDLSAREVVYRVQQSERDDEIVLELIDILMRVVHVMRRRPTLSTLLWIAQLLDYAGTRIAWRLMPPKSLKRVRSATWLRARATGWGYALQRLQRDVLAGVPGSREKLERMLLHEIRCLATGNYGALTWLRPPPKPVQPTKARRTIRAVVSTLRTVTVAAVPLVAVLASQPFLHASVEAFRWARIIAGAWAVLYVLLTLDPLLGDKLDTVRKAAGAATDIKAVGKSGGGV